MWEENRERDIRKGKQGKGADVKESRDKMREVPEGIENTEI